MIKTDLSGRVAMILGGETPFGRALAQAFSSCGANIALCHSPKACAEAVQASVAACTTKAVAFAVDMNDQSAMEAARDQVVECFGKIDILINNTLHETADLERAPLHAIDLEAYEGVITRTIKSVASLTHFVTQDMDKRKSGAIVNVFTVRGVTAVENQTAGVAAGGALVGLSRMWGVELKDSCIRCNGVAVGILEGDPKLPSGDEYRFSHAAVQRPCTNEEAVAAVLFMASDEASYITGTVLPVDGGITAGYARSF